MRHRASVILGAIVLFIACPGRVFADRAAVELVLKQMADAAKAADADAYLSHVSRTDPIFFKEQENWAKDLKRKTPAALSFTIAEPEDEHKEDGAAAATDKPEIPAPTFGEKKSHFELLTTWTMPADKDGAASRERTVSYPALFVLSDNGQWLYAGEDWLTLEGGTDEPRPRDPRFQGPEPAGATLKPAQRGARVKFFAGYEEVARAIVEVLPAVRDHVDEGFQGEVPRVQEVKIYPGMRHLQESIYLSYVDGLSGWNEPGEAIKIITSPRRVSKRSLTGLLAHEYGHVATFELGPKANDMPWWALEGVAELSAERFASGGKDAEAMVMRWHRTDALAKWDDLADFHKVQEDSPRDLQVKVYKQGQHMLMYISDRFGREGRNAWLRAMAQGRTVDEASRNVLKISWEEVDAAWRESVRARVAKLDAENVKKDQEAKKDGDGRDAKSDGKSGD